MYIFAGQQLRHLRDRLKLTLRDVETASSEIAARRANQEFFIPFSRLSEIESKGVLPTIFRIYALAAIYRCDYRQICGWYGAPFDDIAQDSNIAPIAQTHRFDSVPRLDALWLPVALDPAFDVRRTMNLSRMIQRWGVVPLQFVPALARGTYFYAFLGTQDFTMYPLLMPGSFLQIDETRTKVLNEGWRSEYERPIYFVETREEFFCSWCNLADDNRLILQPHPLSPVAPRIFHHPEEAEVVGQVVGVAMRLNEWKFAYPHPSNDGPAQLN